MKKIHLLLFLICITYSIKSQTNIYPEGFYMSFQETVEKSPSQNFNVELEERSEGKIKMNGGNDFQLNRLDKSVKKKIIIKEPFAYSDGSHLFINGFKIGIQVWYAKIEGENSDYFVFKAGIPSSTEIKGIDYSSKPSYMFGGIIAGIGAAKRALIRLPYIFNKNTEDVFYVSKDNIIDFIGSSKDLTEKYSNEKSKEDIDVIYKYLLEFVNQ